MEWDLAVFLTAALALIPPILTGRFLYRFAWADVGVVALTFLMGVSARVAGDWRIGVNLAWEWAAMGVAYVLLRCLPRGRGESAALALGMVVTASAVGAYGIFQGVVELPWVQEEYRRDPEAMRQKIGATGSVDPADAPRSAALDNRVLQSNEPFATFGLANSLAAYLVGPLVLLLATGLRGLSRPSRPGFSRWPALLAAAAPGMVLLTCLVMTKGRSAWVGLMVAAGLLGWRARRLLPRRVLLGAGVAAGIAVATLVVVGLKTGRLDPQVLTQSNLSMRYRIEYWRATWAMINDPGDRDGAAAHRNFWRGVGPGNFGRHYVRYKLPQASEEVQDPHDLFLEAWATAGFWAFLALAAALAAGLGPVLARPGDEDVSADDSGGPPTWPVVASGLGLAMVLVVGRMNLFMEDLLIRWLVLALCWIFFALLLSPLWRRVGASAFGAGSAAAAVAVALLASGGLSFPAVALMLWGFLALGLNLREGRPSGRPREIRGRWPAVALALGWSALVGSYLGATLPFWRSEAAVARAKVALQTQRLDRAEAAYQTAEAADPYNARPWLGHAYLQSLVWEARGARPDDLRWKTIPVLLLKAVSPPRDPNVWSLHSQRAAAIGDLLKRVGNSLSPREVVSLRAGMVEATRTASRLYPTNAALRARLAEASAAISMFGDAAAEAREALRLDALNPHADKKLPAVVRARLKSELPRWDERATAAPPAP